MTFNVGVYKAHIQSVDSRLTLQTRRTQYSLFNISSMQRRDKVSQTESHPDTKTIFFFQTVLHLINIQEELLLIYVRYGIKIIIIMAQKIVIEHVMSIFTLICHTSFSFVYYFYTCHLTLSCLFGHSCLGLQRFAAVPSDTINTWKCIKTMINDMNKEGASKPTISVTSPTPLQT